MNFKPKDKKRTIIILIVAAVAIGIAYFTGFASTRTAMKIGYLGHEGWSSWSGSYVMLNGPMKKTLHPNGEVLNVTVVTKSGTLSIEIKDVDGNVIFDEDNIGTKTYNVDVSGKVSVRIKADNHKGSFSIGN